jgi:hypothetical protein
MLQVAAATQSPIARPDTRPTYGRDHDVLVIAPEGVRSQLHQPANADIVSLLNQILPHLLNQILPHSG